MSKQGTILIVTRNANIITVMEDPGTHFLRLDATRDPNQ